MWMNNKMLTLEEYSGNKFNFQRGIKILKYKLRQTIHNINWTCEVFYTPSGPN